MRKTTIELLNRLGIEVHDYEKKMLLRTFLLKADKKGKREALLKLIREYIKRTKKNASPILDKPEKVYKLLRSEVIGQPEETAYLLLLNNSLGLLSKITISNGGFTWAELPVGMIVRYALLYGAPKIIVAHYHPSGDSSASTADIDITKRLNTACNILEIELIDHVILTDNDFNSMNRMGWDKNEHK